MNLQEFAKLKVGDIIMNPMSHSKGEVVSIDTTGVRIRWLEANGRPGLPDAPTWHYSVKSTAWFHWQLWELTGEDAA